MNIRNKNNFDAIRFIASALVLFSHSFPLVLDEKNEPIFIASEGSVTGGKIAVYVFFILSGFLITASWDNKRNLWDFLNARVRRIFPGLALVLTITIVMGAYLTTANTIDYCKSATIYFIKNLTLYREKFSISGVFEENPYGTAINGSLWTLRHEFTCYLMIAFLGYLRKNRHYAIWAIWLLCITINSLGILETGFLHDFLPLCGWFLAGSLAYVHKDFRPTKIHLITATLVTINSIYFEVNPIFISPLIAYLFIRLSYAAPIFSNFGKYGDFSYGMYIYAFPVQQFVIYLITKSILGPMAWWTVFLVSLPITFVFAVASWHLVEKRFLKRKVAGT